MSVLSTYSDWVAALDCFANGDDEILGQMVEGSFEVDAGTAQRFCLRVEEAYRRRKQTWMDKFSRLLVMQNMPADQDLWMVFRNAKQNLLPICKFISVNAFPESLRKLLQNDLDRFVAEIKKSVTKTFTKTPDRTGEIFLILNSFTLPKSEAEQQVRDGDPDTHKSCINGSSGRKIIF